MRHLDKIIIHCSATAEGKDFRAKDIEQWHKQQGFGFTTPPGIKNPSNFSHIGYHYVIDLDGFVEYGRPMELQGAHCKGQNSSSVGICYIGGLDSEGNPKNTMTPEQEKSLVALIYELLAAHPNLSVHGHNEFAAKACPCFDVQRWAQAYSRIDNSNHRHRRKPSTKKP